MRGASINAHGTAPTDEVLEASRGATACRRPRSARPEALIAMHRFEHGLVVDTKKRGPLTLPYRDLRIYRDATL